MNRDQGREDHEEPGDGEMAANDMESSRFSVGQFLSNLSSQAWIAYDELNDLAVQNRPTT
ncbi:MAG: hypothetical protein P4L33_13200 [Capsulimonadaceae bacterium]|nr:hypothetical protein [Capsulimonadaceae bacterium]